MFSYSPKPLHLVSTSQGENVYGPALPPSLKNEDILAKETIPNPLTSESDSVEDDLYGPPLPPHLLKKATILSKTNESESDDEVYGPLPANKTGGYDELEEVEKRARLMKDKLLGDQNTKKSRETWMLELPEAKAKQFGLGPRTFSKKQASDAVIDSSWTDSPGKSSSYSKERINVELMEKHLVSERDRQMEEIAQEHCGEGRKESLLKAHQKSLKRKAVSFFSCYSV
ncbi:hypothetical protein QYM36_001716 [Artemia franciscana]|uniref:GPALPP motifs-containing protein 1 n=1 Tax=Artemia franciscana TaxID=6661 RepID=A0AA88IAQ4_ARTSF|nr:hypothetical protein QYM36_001716 [Artemia franciscana]KAK2723129.1 hypothetical protein QYM36_001716 [Artemia franciscana]